MFNVSVKIHKIYLWIPNNPNSQNTQLLFLKLILVIW